MVKNLIKKNVQIPHPYRKVCAFMFYINIYNLAQCSTCIIPSEVKSWTPFP